MRQPLNDPALHINRPAEKEEVEIERNTRNFVKRLLIFGLTEQVLFLSLSVLSSLSMNIPDVRNEHVNIL